MYSPFWYIGGMKNLNQIREVSILSFDERVLQEAEDRRNPLMERLKFLGIFSSNMDEFFKVRVAGIHRRIELGDDTMPAVLELVSRKAQELDERFQAAYKKITRALAKDGVSILTETEVEGLPEEDRGWLAQHFHRTVLPRLVPLILQDARPIPPLNDGSLYFGVEMSGKKPAYAIIELPPALDRFVELPSGNIMYVDDVIRFFLNDIFYIFSYERISAYAFKLSRDADLDMDNDFSEDYVHKMERMLQQRKGGRPTRFVYDAEMPKALLVRLLDELKIGEQDTIIGGGRYHNMRDLMGFPAHRPDLSFERALPAPHPVLDGERRPMLDIIADRDVLLTYPYQSFGHLVRLLREAAIAPDVRAIKMTLYRAAKNSQMVNALCNAARNGKRVFVSIELQARFDEEHNIELAERLTEAGASVVYGVPPMKTHCKLLLIQKKKGRLFAGLSTGNFNESTGRLYVDSALLTADPRLASEVDAVFDFLKAASRMRMFSPPAFKHLLVSPFNTRKVLYRMINRERLKGKDGYILLKTNHLTDVRMIQRLRRAANAGVKMDLIVRTTCALTPHANIRAISILDRYLEHQRVYLFGKGKDRTVFMSSADLMERNLDWRMEAAFPIYDAELQQQVVKTMKIQVEDTFKARELDRNQTNAYISEGDEGKRSQEVTQRYFDRLGGHGKAEDDELLAAEY